jgi:hypothetical protein
MREEDSNIITLKPTLTLYFQAVQYAWSHYTGGDSNLITLKPTLTLYFQAVQSLTAFEGNTGIFLF